MGLGKSCGSHWSAVNVVLEQAPAIADALLISSITPDRADIKVDFRRTVLPMITLLVIQ